MNFIVALLRMNSCQTFMEDVTGVKLNPDYFQSFVDDFLIKENTIRNMLFSSCFTSI